MRRIFSGKDTGKNNGKKSREEIEAEAFTQMRKAKAAIDPGVLAKVRAAIQNSPIASQLMGNVYAQKGETSRNVVTKEPVEQPVEKMAKPISKPVSQEAPSTPIRQRQGDQARKEKALLAAKKAHASIKDVKEEPVDQAKMLDVVAKMLELNPHKAELKNGVKDILKRK